VPDSELPRIFEPFHQVASARSPDERGYGLGLAVTAGAARLHGGSVAARNHPEGGLEVTLQLGRTPPAA
jgi:two-component system sensor histidine kinase CpxA